MVRFSCFHTHIHSHKSKKTIQQSSKAIHKTFQDCPQDPALNVSSIPTSLDPFLFKAHDNNPFNTSAEKVSSSPSVENCWKSEEMDSSFSPEGNVEVHQTGRLKKCQSLGSGLDKEEFVSSGIDTEYEIDKGFSCDDSHEKNYSGTFDALDHSGLVEQFDSKDPGTILLNQYPEVMVSESFQVNFDLEHSETIFSIGDSKQLPGEVHGDFVTQLSDEHANDAGHHPPGTPPMIAKSCSLPNMGACITSEEESPYHEYIVPHCISSEDLDAQDVKKKEFLNHDIESHAMADQERDNSIFEIDKDKCENSFGNGYDSYNLAGSANDWTIPGTYGVDKLKSLQGESSVHRWDELTYKKNRWDELPSKEFKIKWDELPSKEFKIKRIEEWVSSIDLEDSTPFQEINESCYPTEVKKVSNTLGGVTTARLDSKTIPGVEVAKAYISSLTATSTSAQLTNLGLVAIPFLSAFVNLKILNLSGNAIVRITAGALPRGLHMLNLSKNNISTIEGLRELTRLRVLDLSYNRIFKIGHGLASCSSLKELYLAGNKINEVEGLHRLLKLSILDLRFNKISTATCLGQLAANYSSLQAIYLEGNPAQRNVGDEQLKKYLQGLLPHLVYFNKQPIKASSSKEVTDRSTRSAITAHQFDRSLRSENKITKRGSRGVATQKTSSSNHGRLSQALISSKQSKGRHGYLLPSRAKETNLPLDLGRKLLGLESNLSLKRSQSEGTLGPS